MNTNRLNLEVRPHFLHIQHSFPGFSLFFLNSILTWYCFLVVDCTCSLLQPFLYLFTWKAIMRFSFSYVCSLVSVMEVSNLLDIHLWRRFKVQRNLVDNGFTDNANLMVDTKFDWASCSRDGEITIAIAKLSRAGCPDTNRRIAHSVEEAACSLDCADVSTQFLLL